MAELTARRKIFSKVGERRVIYHTARTCCSQVKGFAFGELRHIVRRQIAQRLRVRLPRDRRWSYVTSKRSGIGTYRLISSCRQMRWHHQRNPQYERRKEACIVHYKGVCCAILSSLRQAGLTTFRGKVSYEAQHPGHSGLTQSFFCLNLRTDYCIR